MSGDFVGALQPVVSALQDAITIQDVVNLFASAVMVALPIILIWYRLQVLLSQICACREADGRG